MALPIDHLWRPATQQLCFRRLMEAMSAPGTIVELPLGASNAPAALGVLATLLDHTTTLCDLDAQISPLQARFLESRRAPAADCDFLLARGDLPPSTALRPRLGTLAAPDGGTTLILTGERIGKGGLTVALRGAGIQSETIVRLAGFHPRWFEQRDHWVGHFPLGVDLLLTDATRVLALPRTTHLHFIGRATAWAM